MGPEPTEVALLGCDHPHSTGHLGTLLTMPEATGIHLWDPEPKAADRLRAKAGEKLVKVHSELDDLLTEPAIGWLLVSLRNDLTPAVLLRCAAAGKPVLTEKPMGRSWAEVEPVVTAFREAGLSLAVCFQNRYKPGARQLREWCAQGCFGRLCSAETRLHTTQVKLRDPGHWLFQNAISGGGILPWLGCHYLDLLRYVMAAEPVAVTAQTAILSGEAIDVEDLAVLTIRFDNDVLSACSFGYVMPGGRPGYLSPGYDTWFGLKGTGGQAQWEVAASDQRLDALSLHPDWAGAPARTVTFKEVPTPAYGGEYGLQFARDCLAAAQRGEDGPATGEDMLAVWAMIEAAYRSQREGRRAELATRI